MGFSVSGSAAIIFAALFIAFGMWSSAASNSLERVTDARADRTDHVLETGNTDVEITAATYDANNSTLEIHAENLGATQLGLEETDLTIDGDYRADWQSSAAVAGDGQTDLWAPTKELVVTLGSIATQPDHVKLVTGTGVSDTAEVTSA